jgi:site-specific DNA-methyltransferase (adenine-specific)
VSGRVEHLAEGVTLYLGDCRDILPTLGKVDAVVTDPPYAEKTHAGARTGGGDEILIDFSSITDDEFVRLCRQFCEIANRWVIMTCDWRHAAEAERQLPELFIRAGVWIKPNGMPQYTGDRPATGWESVAILHRVGRKVWNGGGRHAVWTVPKVHGNHPTEKPLPLISEWLRLFTDLGDHVLDPFMGSGTTGVACAKHGRRFTGVEREAKYFDIACRRISEALRQPDMFIEKPKPIEQARLDLL